MKVSSVRTMNPLRRCTFSCEFTIIIQEDICGCLDGWTPGSATFFLLSESALMSEITANKLNSNNSRATIESENDNSCTEIVMDDCPRTPAIFHLCLMVIVLQPKCDATPNLLILAL